MIETEEDDDDSKYKQARKTISRAQSVRVFTFHLIAFILGNGFLGFWNVVT